MIQDFQELGKQIKSVLMFNKNIQSIINDYNLLYLSEQITRNDKNQKIFENIEKSKVMIVNKHQNNSDLFIIGFEKTIILIKDEKSFSLLKELFQNKNNLKISFLNTSNDAFNQYCTNKYPKLNNNIFLKEEIQSFKSEIHASITKKNLSEIWNFVSESIYLYLINKSYNKLTRNRIRNHINNNYSPILTINEEDYIKLRRIGSGSSFHTDLIYHIEREELYVIKIPYGSDNSEKYISREKKNYSFLQRHPLIPKFLGETNKGYLVIEYIDGETLDNIVIYLNYKQMIKIITQLMQIMEFIHYNHFLYRDLKPNNIIIDKDFNAVLIDFDKMIPKEYVNIKQTFDFSNWIAPEVSKSQDLSYYSDIYSLGLVIYFIINKVKKEILSDYNRYKVLAKMFEILSKTSLACTSQIVQRRPTIYGIIRQIKKECYSEMDLDSFDILLQLNQKAATDNITSDETDSYLKIIYCFSALEKLKEIKKCEHIKRILDDVIINNYEEAIFIRNKIFNEENQGSVMIRNTIYGFIDSYFGNHIINQSEYNFYQDLINGAKDDPIYCFHLGRLYLKLVDNREITKKEFQYISEDYEYFLKNKSFFEKLAKISPNIPRDIKKGLMYLQMADERGQFNASYFLGIIYSAKIFQQNNDDSSIFNLRKYLDKNFKEDLDKLTKINLIIKGDTLKGIKYIEKAAEGNFPLAQILLASLYYDSKYIKPDIGKCIYYLQSAADKNIPTAQYMLGYIYYFGKDKINKNIEKAIYNFELSEKHDYPFAEFALAKIYFDAEYVNFDVGKIIYYLTRASKQDLPDAQVFLALFNLREEINIRNHNDILLASISADKSSFDTNTFLNKLKSFDKYIKPDINRGIELLNKAAKQDSINACLMLGILYLDSPSKKIVKEIGKAEDYLKKCVNQNNAMAQYLLALIYEKNKKNTNEIIKYLELSANQGYALAQFSLGELYSTLYSDVYDIDLAIKYLIDSAKKGIPKSFYKLGNIYFKDKYKKRNTEKAIEYYKIAADKNYGMAQYIIGNLYLKGEIVKQDINKGKFYIEQSSNNEFPRGIFALGYLNHKGEVIKQNIIQAKKLYIDALNLNDYYSRNNLAIIYKNGFGNDIKKNATNAELYLTEGLRYFYKANDDKNEIYSYNLAHLYIYEIQDARKFDESINLLLKSENNLIDSKYLLCLALVLKYQFDLNIIRQKLASFYKCSFIYTNLIVELISKLRLTNQEKFIKYYEKYRNIYFLYDSGSKPISSIDFFKQKNQRNQDFKSNKKDLTYDFYEGLGIEINF